MLHFFRCLSLLLAATWPCYGLAQLPDCAPQLRPVLDIHPLARFELGAERLLNDQLRQTWDSIRQAYRGDLSSYFYYPQLVRAGYHSFRILEGCYPQNFPEDSQAAGRAIQEAELSTGARTRRDGPWFYYDSTGWLRAVITIAREADSSIFSQKRDSFDYTFSKGRLAAIALRHSYVFVRGHPPDCPRRPGDTIFHQNKNVLARLDALENVVYLEEQWDEYWEGGCRSDPPSVARCWMTYDSQARLLAIRSSVAGTDSATTIILQYQSYAEKDFSQAGIRPDIARLLKDSSLTAFLSQQRPLQLEVRTVRDSGYRGQPIRRNYTLMNRAHRPVLVWDEGGNRNWWDAELLDYGAVRGRTSGSYERRQLLRPVGIDDRKSAGPEVAQVTVTTDDRYRLEAGTVRRLLQQGRLNRQEPHPAPAFGPVALSALAPAPSASQNDDTWICFACALTDRQSLLRYWWTSCQSPGLIGEYGHSLSRQVYRLVYK